MYSIGEVAKILNVSVKTLQRWDKDGKLKAYRHVSNRRYYTKEQIDKYLGRNTNKDTKNDESL